MPRLIFGIIVMAVMGVIAHKKGFNPWAWVLAGGLIGFIILLALPSANADEIDDTTRDARAKRGNTVGIDHLCDHGRFDCCDSSRGFEYVNKSAC